MHPKFRETCPFTILEVKTIEAIINKQSRIPLYIQLMDIIINQIERGEYKPNDKLPSERELCEKYDVSRMTVRQALLELERDGYIYKKHGLGSFVSPRSINQKLDKLYSFTEEMKKLGKHPESIIYQFETIPATKKIAEKLKISADEEMHKIIRIRLADKEPLMYETTFLPAGIFRNLTKKHLESKPMYDVFRDDYHINITKAIEKFSVTKVRAEEAKWLNVKNGDPAMLIKRYLYSGDMICEYTISVARGDKFIYSVELSN
ncbi:MAG: GntR family transcriptional regulator [Caldibacillus debilis]|nr:MAG: GntR family transcriptional regulator [Caldibacillus debilis]